MNGRNREALERADQATLEELQARYPADWTAVGARLVAASETRRPEVMAAFLRQAADEDRPWRARLQKGRGGAKDLPVVLRHLARARMAKLAAEQVLAAAAVVLATKGEGRRGEGATAAKTARLGWWSGILIQRLLFARELQRKPASLTAFRWLWPLVGRRRLLMPLVQPKGIYCFYSRELIAALAALIAGRACLELAAGDGTLARFLAAAGVPVRAVDDRSWAHAIAYPAEVEALDAVSALARERPEVVICSFPPPGNTFEREIFRTREVDLYVVITTRHRFAAGDWAAYEQQRAFEWEADARLSRLVLPPEVDPAVLVFRRRR